MFWCESMIQSQRQHTADMLAAVGKGKSLSTETTWTERPLNREEAMTPKDEKNSRLQENYLEEEVTLQSEKSQRRCDVQRRLMSEISSYPAISRLFQVYPSLL